jgi:Beta-propeller repeat
MVRLSRNVALALAVLLSCLLGKSASTLRSAPQSTSDALAKLSPVSISARQAVPGNSCFVHLPLSFEPNRGQMDLRVKFAAKGPGYDLFFTTDGLTLSAPHSDSSTSTKREERRRDIVKVSYVGINRESTVSGVDKLPGRINYLIRNPKQWHTDVPIYRRVSYDHLYSGVTVTYYGNEGQLENDFVVAPHHDPNRISFIITGSGIPRLSSGGDLVIEMPSGSSFEIRKPKAYQVVDGVQKTVEAQYSLTSNRVRFAVGAFDSSQNLIIDPVVLYSTYLGGMTVPGDDGAFADAVAVDSSGNLYIAGLNANQSFPVTPGSVQESKGNGFVSKIDPTGTTLIYSAIVEPPITSIAVDGKGDVYAVGPATAGFPTTAGAVQPAPLNTTSLSQTPLIFELNAAGNGFIYATYLGGSSGDDVAFSIAVDSGGNAYVTGDTESNDFPTMNPLQAAFGGGISDGFVSKINPTGTALIYSTYLGGSAEDDLRSIAVDGTGDAHVTGWTRSANFPTANAFQPNNDATPGNTNAVMVELNAAGSSLVYSTYLGGSAGAFAASVATDPSGVASVAGFSNACDFPLKNALEPGCEGDSAFIAQFDPSGGLNFSTYFGGASQAQPNSVALDGAANIYLSGSVNTTGLTLVNPVQSSGPYFVSKIDPSGSTLMFSTYFGSATPALGNNAVVTVDATENIYLAGGTTQGLPVISALDPVFLGGETELAEPIPAVFIAKIASTNAPAAGFAPGAINFGNQPVGTTSSPQTVTITDLGSVALGITSISSGGDFQQTNNCGTGISAGGATCAVMVTFTPTIAGSRTGSIVVTDDAASSPQTVMLTGSGGVPAASVSPTSVAFSNVSVGSSSAPQTVSLTNAGTADLAINLVSITGDFTETNNCGTDLPYTGEDGSTGTCQISVVFTPTTSGPRSGTLSITDNAAGSPQTVSLSGNPSPPSFSISTAGGSSSASVAQGQTATYSLNVSGSNGFAQAVNFSLSGVPNNTTWSVTPNPANVSGTAAVGVKVSIVTQAASTVTPVGIRWPKLPARVEFLLWTAIVLSFLVGFAPKRISAFWKTVPAGLVIVLLAMCAACGGSSPHTPTSQTGTPVGQYTITVTGTAGSSTQNMQLSLTVN